MKQGEVGGKNAYHLTQKQDFLSPSSAHEVRSLTPLPRIGKFDVRQTQLLQDCTSSLKQHPIPSSHFLTLTGTSSHITKSSRS